MHLPPSSSFSSAWVRRWTRKLMSVWRRWSLWALLLVLVLAVLGTLVWLAGRYEASQVQSRMERDVSDAANDIRSALGRNVQSMQALHAGEPTPASWTVNAESLLRERRELMHLEWRDSTLRVLAKADTPYRAPVFEDTGRNVSYTDVTLACASARKTNGPSYSSSYFLPRTSGTNGATGLEVVEMCLPLNVAGRVTGYVLATYALQEVLASMVGGQLTRGQEVSFTEVDGTRLAMHGAARRGTRLFTAQQVLDLPGNTVVLRMDSWHGAPSLFPNVLTALVTAMSIALVSVLVVLAKDNRRRLRAERDLADALAFRKAMEDSLVTGLRARDLKGHITYVNPAFCQMVGFTADELMGLSAPLPYWPPELAQEYQRRQEVRFAGNLPPREGLESLFMRKDGTRFPVLVMEAPLITAQGFHTGWMSAVLDISEQRRIEELSRASQERLQATARLATVGEMASLLSHELNQPLAAISSYATGSMNLLRDRQQSSPGDAGALAESDDMLQTAVRRIAEQAERAGRVIKSVHDFVRRRDQERELIRPQALLDAIMPLVILQARKLDVLVRTVVPADLPALHCDRTMVEQVLLNLARNGMQAMDHADTYPRELLIQVRRGASGTQGGGWLEFSVTDYGAGISDDVARQLFTPFFTTKPEGMGLGLSLCRTVVEQHGGALQYRPHQPKGTVFTFTLPIKNAD